MSSDNIDAKRVWAAAWAEAWANMPPIPKTHTAKIGDKFSYKYADLPDIIDAVRPVLAKYGLSVAQAVVPVGDGLLGVTTTIYHSAGHSESFGPTPMPAVGDPRAIGSAITYARRYSLTAALGIASDEDTDAEGTVGKSRQKATTATTMPQEARKPARSTKTPDPYAQHKQAALAAIQAEYPDATADEHKRLALAHWPAGVEAAGENASPEAVADKVLALVRLEAPFT